MTDLLKTLHAIRRHCGIVADYRRDDAADARRLLEEPIPECCGENFRIKYFVTHHLNLKKSLEEEAKWRLWEEALTEVINQQESLEVNHAVQESH